MITTLAPLLAPSKKKRRVDVPDPPGDKSNVGDAVEWLFKVSRKLRPGSAYVSGFTGSFGRWTWAINGNDEAVPLDPPMLPPPGGPDDGSRVRGVLARYIFIFLDDVFIGYFTETGGGFGVGDFKLPTVYDMLHDFDMHGMGSMVDQLADELYANDEA